MSDIYPSTGTYMYVISKYCSVSYSCTEYKYKVNSNLLNLSWCIILFLSLPEYVYSTAVRVDVDYIHVANLVYY